jgi:iron complex transport system substrate-binding protein
MIKIIISKIRKEIVKAILILLIFLNFNFIYGNKKIVDDLGESIELSSAPQRIISLAPNITEILFALGLDKQIVGVTRYCNYPPEAQSKERIGGIIDINFEKIKFLKPDLVLAFRGNRLDSVKRLKELNIRVFVINSVTKIEDIFLIIEKIGKVTFKGREAKNLNKKLKEKYNFTIRRLHHAEKYPRVFISLHGGEFWTCGKKSFLNDLIVKAKAKNIAGNVHQAWIKYNPEELIFRNPDIIIILAKNEKDFNISKSILKKNNVFNRIKAVKNNKIFYINEDMLSRQGPRLIDGFIKLARIVHPEVF